MINPSELHQEVDEKVGKLGTIQIEKPKAHNLDLLIAASDSLIKEGLLEEVERTINTRTMCGDTYDNSQDLSESFILGKKRPNKLQKKCQNEGCDTKGKTGKTYKIDKEIYKCSIDWLCRRCMVALKNKQYCYYCFLIYTTETNDNQSWVQCDYCTSWHHVLCEEGKGKYKNIMRNNGVKKYKCPHCRVKKINKRKTAKTVLVDDYARNYNQRPYNNSPMEENRLFPSSNKSYLNQLGSDYKAIYHDLMKINN